MIWCLHGAVGSSRDWDEFGRLVGEAGYVCRAVDLWRFLECEGMGLWDWARAFHAEVKADGDEERILLGYSMGGRLALHALLEEPELWDRVIVVSAHPGLVTEEERLERMAADARWAGQALTGDWGEFVEAWNEQGVLEGSAGGGERSLLVNRRRAIARSFMEWSLGRQEDLGGRLRDWEGKGLWVTGQRDEKFATLSEGAGESFERLVIEGAGHRVPWDKPAEFGLAVLDWVRKAD
ncbi:MAG: alpha/beta fold hydrolase [Verrucomicrobiota bacterium]